MLTHDKSSQGLWPGELKRNQMTDNTMTKRNQMTDNTMTKRNQMTDNTMTKRNQMTDKYNDQKKSDDRQYNDQKKSDDRQYNDQKIPNGVISSVAKGQAVPAPLATHVQLIYNHIHVGLIGFGFMELNITFNNISVILWQSVLLVEETRVPVENH